MNTAHRQDLVEKTGTDYNIEGSIYGPTSGDTAGWRGRKE